jgi:hypothetical protein
MVGGSGVATAPGFSDPCSPTSRRRRSARRHGCGSVTSQRSAAMPRTGRTTATLTALQRLTRRQNMRRSIVTCGVVALALAASVLGLTGAKGASERRAFAVSGMPIVVRCPRASDRRESGFPTADHVIVVARRVNAREVTHYQGRAVRRTATNTPVDPRGDPLPGTSSPTDGDEHASRRPCHVSERRHARCSWSSGLGGPREEALWNVGIGELSGDVL